MIKKPALFIIASAFVLSACSYTNSGQTTTPTTPVAPATGATTPQTQNQLTISNYAFSPQSLTVAAGSTVKVTNNDSTTHTITSDDKGASFNIPSIPSGSSASFTAPSKPGTYTFHCNIHKTMTGTLIVQ